MNATDIETLSLRLKADYMHKYGLRELRKVVCACVLSGSRRCMGRKVVHSCRPPASDHSATFKVIDTDELVMIEQPYAGREIRGTDGVAALTAACEAFAKEWGLAVRISADESFHYPGHTVLIEYRRKS